MIFQQLLKRELGLNALAIFLILLAIMLASMTMRILGYAALGKANPSDILILISLAILSYLPILLAGTLFIAILLVITRWYKDHEILAWFAAGISIRQLLYPTLRFAFPLIILVALSAFFVMPWSFEQSTQLQSDFQNQEETSLMMPGQFRVLNKQNLLLFVKAANKNQLSDIFIAKTNANKINITVSQKGYVESRENGNRFVILEQGHHYEGSANAENYRISSFERYGIKLPDAVNTNNLSFKAIPSAILFSTLFSQKTTPAYQAELIWRISLPFLAFNLVLLAIPLARQAPRQKYHFHFISAVLLFFSYSNLINFMQHAVLNQKIPFSLAWWILHLAITLIAAFLYWWHSHLFSLSKLFSFQKIIMCLKKP